jgi:hypothetical protein
VILAARRISKPREPRNYDYLKELEERDRREEEEKSHKKEKSGEVRTRGSSGLSRFGADFKQGAIEREAWIQVFDEMWI